MTLCVSVHELCRFVLADLAGLCRCKVVLEYFEESTAVMPTTGPCCDVCQTHEAELSDASQHMEIVLQAVQTREGHGEKKVHK